jgi:serine protease Do
MKYRTKQNVRQLTVLGGFLFLFLIHVSTSQANDNPTVERLKEIQAKISSVAANNMDACVAISDGVGFGSGVIISPEGLVLTAGHVMASEDEGQYQIILPSGKTVAAKALGKNLDTDAGMVQITDPGPWPFIEINRSSNLKRGDWVVSLGHSGGFELGRNPPVRSGRILGRNRSQILTDAVLIGGDSGGPLFDLDGKLIGIHSSIGDSIAENRHVSMNVFVRDWDRLKRGDSWGRLPDLNESDQQKRRGLIGVRLNLNAPNALIRAVDQGMPASEAGVKVGDVVTQFDSVKIANGRQLIDLIKQKFAGDVCPMTVLRNGQLIRFDITLR